MRIDVYDGKNFFFTLPFSEYLYCVSSSIKVSNTFLDFNSQFGSSYKNYSSTLNNKTFSITGNIEVSSPDKVEETKSIIFYCLYNRKLRLFTDDHYSRYYNCVLDGNVTITYNHGEEISRVFTLSFSLCSTSPFSYDSRKYEERFNDRLRIQYKGHAPCFPIIKFYASNSFILRPLKEPLIHCNNKVGQSFIRLKKEISVNEKDNFFIQNGLPILNEQVLPSDVLDPISVLKPIVLVEGDNYIYMNYNTPYLSAIIIWNNVYY